MSKTSSRSTTQPLVSPDEHQCTGERCFQGAWPVDILRTLCTNTLEVVEAHGSTSWPRTEVPEGPSPPSHMNATERRWMIQLNFSAKNSRGKGDERTALTTEFLYLSFPKALYNVR